MKTIKTSELSGLALNYAVALCEDTTADKASFYIDWFINADGNFTVYAPSSNWLQGGPIIEREKITPHADNEDWVAQAWRSVVTESGNTPLIAAMRCYVASKLGDTVDIPDELV